MGEFIKIKTKDGGKFRAWKALPDKGSGPGIVLVPETHGINDDIRGLADRFAEEGYVVLVPDLFWRIESGVSLNYSDAEIVRGRELATRLDTEDAVADLVATVKSLRKMDELKGSTGIVGYGLGGTLALLAAARTGIDCVASYYPADIASVFKQVKRIKCPAVLHLAGNDNDGKISQDEIRHAFRKRKDAEIYLYPGAARGFAMVGREEFDKSASLMAYSRTLALLRKVLGPRYDLGHLWEMHCYHEFATRDVDAVMSTMVAEPYVNHVPAMTGGVGHAHLKRFYKYHFVDSNPEDTKLIPLSRTIGTDRVVDEMLFCFTHTREIDWMLPGIKPTGKYVEIPLVAIVCFRGGKLYSEHIYWDQASVLAQIGVLNTKGLPVAGVETAKKLLDETRPSNELMESLWKKSEGKPL